MEKKHTAAEFFYDDSFNDYESKRLYRIGDTITVRADFDAVAALESILVDELIKAAALEKELDAEGISTWTASNFVSFLNI